jgi:hypothetical protein
VNVPLKLVHLSLRAVAVVLRLMHLDPLGGAAWAEGFPEALPAAERIFAERWKSSRGPPSWIRKAFADYEISAEELGLWTAAVWPFSIEPPLRERRFLCASRRAPTSPTERASSPYDTGVLHQSATPSLP